MVVIFLKSLAFFWVKQVISSYKLKNHASQRPNISTLIILPFQKHFRRAVFARLNYIGIVAINVAGITHIAKLDVEILLSYFFELFWSLGV